MKKIIVLFICISLLLSAGCKNETVTDNSDSVSTVSNNENTESDVDNSESVSTVSNSENIENSVDNNIIISNVPTGSNVQSNLISGGQVNENENCIIFDDFIYDKSSGKISILCKDPVCSHTQSMFSAESECILVRNIYCLQIYNDNILCTSGSESNIIYKLDPETGTLSVFYEADMQIDGFRLYGEHNAIISSDDGTYALDFETGESLQLIEGITYNSFYTNDDNYLYISMENLTLHRIDLNTGEDVILVERGAQPVIHGSRLYYQYITEDEWSLYSMNIDGSGKALILDDVVSYSIYNDKIYYTTASYPRKSMICDTNGKNSKEVLSDSVSFYIFPESEKIIMWLQEDYNYKIMDLDGSNIENLAVPEWQ